MRKRLMSGFLNAYMVYELRELREDWGGQMGLHRLGEHQAVPLYLRSLPYPFMEK